MQNMDSSEQIIYDSMYSEFEAALNESNTYIIRRLAAVAENVGWYDEAKEFIKTANKIDDDDMAYDRHVDNNL